VPSWEQVFWLEALLLADPGAAAGAEMAWLAFLPAGESRSFSLAEVGVLVPAKASRRQ
jgi:hypothetical protein